MRARMYVFEKYGLSAFTGKKIEHFGCLVKILRQFEISHEIGKKQRFMSGRGDAYRQKIEKNGNCCRGRDAFPGPFATKDNACESKHVTFGKGKVQPFQGTIEHIDITYTARYIHVQNGLYSRKIPKARNFENPQF